VTPLESPSYADALAALQARGRFGIRLGLGRTRALLRALGHPEREVRGVLIAGTNGKGSVQALVAEALRRAGSSVGQTPKPHLVSYRERIVVDGEPIAADELAGLLAEVMRHADRRAPSLGAATEFELVTAAAFAWFARRRVEVAVVEVGLGGRLDATNAWDGGVAAVTNVGRDHMEQLGDTIAAIAREKAAVIKRGDRAVTGAEGEALGIIRRRARRMDVGLEVALPLDVRAMDRSGLLVEHPRLGTLRVGLLGRHQAANAAVAVAVLDALAAAGIATVSDDAIRDAFRDVRWPGRVELLTGTDLGAYGRADPVASVAGAPDVLLDGAHNEPGAAALATTLDELAASLSPGRATLLTGIVADKEVERVVAALARAAPIRGGRVIVTSVPGTPRSLEPALHAAAWRRAVPPAEVIVEGDVDAALEMAIEHGRRDNGPVIVAGSLYLVGHVRGRLVDDPSLRDPRG
jgi:dihydrofolate synthase / folylpolyglutamate synthase